MRFRVQGVDRRSGKPVMLSLDAATPGDAAYDAAALGVDVGSIEQDAGGPAPLPQSDPGTLFPRDDGRTVLIELTSKRIKLGLAAAAIVSALALLVAGIGLMLVFRRQQFAGPGIVALWISGALFTLAVALMVVFRLKAWWRHG